MQILRNIGTLAVCARSGAQDDVQLVHNAALVWNGDRITWAGPAEELPANLGTAVMFDARGGLVIPALVDCHTHLAFGGWRADEFERRCRGESYEQIAAQGGGIAATVRATRASDDTTLMSRARGFLEGMAQLGVGTVECKSGYGLSLDGELRILRAYRALSDMGPCRIVPTLLAAHAVPAEFRDNRAGYLRMVTEELIPAVATERLARFCDAFVDRGAFSVEEARIVFAAARDAGLRPKLHADQLSASGGAELAAEVGAISADHLEHVSDAGIGALRRAGTVAVSLPIASLYLRQPPLPARRLIEAGVPVAVATDFNPGSAPSFHLPFAMTLACTMQMMTPAEVLKGATSIAASAIGMADEIGSLEPGRRADFVVLDADDVNQWLYHLQANACRWTVIAGRTAWKAGK
jgi:imidazolonepropionase